MSAIFPGSFDPVTLGHVDIARRAAGIFGSLVVAVLENPSKTPLFSIDERVALLNEVFNEDNNIEVEVFDGLLVDFAKQKGIETIIRGLRTPEDFSREMPYAVWNHRLANVETVYLTANPELMHVSSSIVKEVAAHSCPDEIARTIPPAVLKALKHKYYK